MAEQETLYAGLPPVTRLPQTSAEEMLLGMLDYQFNRVFPKRSAQ